MSCQHFTIPSTLFGRERELEMIRNVIRHTSSSHLRHNSNRDIVLRASPTGSQDAATSTHANDDDDNASSRSESSQTPATPGVEGFANSGSATSSAAMSPSGFSPALTAPSPITLSPRPRDPWITPNPDYTALSVASSVTATTDGLRRAALASAKTRVARVHSVILYGAAGAGKSSLILANQPRWRCE
jgi:hypothetical protein